MDLFVVVAALHLRYKYIAYLIIYLQLQLFTTTLLHYMELHVFHTPYFISF